MRTTSDGVSASQGDHQMDQTRWPGQWHSALTSGDRYPLEIDRHPRYERWFKGLLAVGFAALSAGVLVAHANPATGYELSIYRATPVEFWLGVGVALLCALIVSFLVGAGRLRMAALVLAGGAVIAIAALPILRGYYFFGAADPLTHLGWTREMASGVLSPSNFLYPGLHTISLFIAETTGVPLTLAIQYGVLAFLPVYLLFVPLCVRSVAGHGWAVPMGVFSAALLLPINNVSVFFMAHPTTQAILASPLVLYLVFEHVTGSRDGPLSVTSTGILLAVTSAGFVLVHPQQALNVLIIFWTISALQFLIRWRGIDHPIAEHRPLYAQTAFFTVCSLVWLQKSERATEIGIRILQDLLAIGIPADEAAQRSESLAAVGGSIEELFVKLFLVSLVYAILAGLFMLASIAGRLDDLPRHNALGLYLTAAFVPLFGGFVALLIASHTTQHFRQVGFIMMVVTILGAAAVSQGIRQRSIQRLPRGILSVVGVCLAVCLVLSMATMFFSPYIYQPSSQITEARLDGYETAFEHAEPGVPFTGIRSGVQREADAIYGSEAMDKDPIPGYEAVVPPTVFETNLTEYYNQSRYLIVTRRNVKTELGIYDGFRYSAAGFRSLEATPGVHLVMSNGAVRVYLITDEERN